MKTIFNIALTKFKNSNNSTKFILSFLTVILTGAGLLSLPIASYEGIEVSYIDALFTATSAVCVTGLVTLPTFATWTIFGKLVILILIQIGGLGLITLVIMLYVLLGRKVSVKDRLFISHSFNQDHFDGMVNLLRHAIIGTLCVEFIAAMVLATILHFKYDYGVLISLWYGIFHSVSAFCNAGFDVLGNDSLAWFANDFGINFTIMFLIVTGGLGFSVWVEVASLIRNYKQNKKISLSLRIGRLSLHTKLVLLYTFGLIVSGSLFFLVAEYNNPDTIGNFTFMQKVVATTFQSVTLRTAGFFTIVQDNLHYSSKFVSVILMYIGGSPGGTAGGIKTTTFALILLSIASIAKGKYNIEAFNRTIPFNLLLKCLSISMLNLFLIIFSTLMLTITETNFLDMNGNQAEFLDFLFETTSAVSTVGVSTGITADLSFWGKVVLLVCMFFGRIGTITIIISLTIKQNKITDIIKYPDEKILLG